MVKITNGASTFEVTRGAYDTIYSKQGYKLLEKPAAAEDNHGKSADEAFAESVVEKPLSQWSKDEVKRFASINSIDITGTKSVNEAKNIIKQYIDGVSV